ncbi:MAG: GNAT family N-acetyltransferase [Pseudomonadota bacterium]
MTAPPPTSALPIPRPGLEVRRAVRPTLSFYRYLYDAIGADWVWYERKLLDDTQLAGIIHDPQVEVNVLWSGAVPAGLAELDRRDRRNVELAYFGIVPEFIGQGLGRYLIEWAVGHVWRDQTRRFWVHTCDLDHPRAISVYQKAGFRIYDRQMTMATPPSS